MLIMFPDHTHSLFCICVIKPIGVDAKSGNVPGSQN